MAIDFSQPELTLRTKPLGFDKEEVRTLLQNLATDYEEARRQIDRLSAELRAAQASPTAQPVRQESTGVQVERVLASAHRVAEEVRVEAETTARRLLQEAQDEASQMRIHAEADAAALTRTAATRLAELKTEVQEMIDRRDAVQAMLDRAADRLTEIAQDLRSPVVTPNPQEQGSSESRVTAII